MSWRAPAPDRGDDLVGGVLLDVVTSPLQQDGAVIGEEPLPAPAFAIAERDVLRRPDDERRAIAQPGKLLLDVGEEGPAGKDLSREDGRRAPRGRRREGSAIGVHDYLRQRPPAHAGGEEALDEQVAIQDQPAADGAAEQSREELCAGIALRPGP